MCDNTRLNWLVWYQATLNAQMAPDEAPAMARE
jgi:hypothetical protein